MSALRRTAVKTAGRLPTALRSTRAYSSDHNKAGEGEHHSSDHGHHHAPPQNESLGGAFFIAIAAIPISVGVYVASRPSVDGKAAGFSKSIDSYSYYKERWAARNTLHTAMIEQAAFDRNLYQSDSGSAHVELRFPEVFNSGSPFNISAGQGARNMEELVAHYEKLNGDAEEKKLRALSEKKN